LLKIKTWGTKWKRKIDKTIKWAAWRWVNVKINKESITLLKKTVNMMEDMEDYHWAMFTHAMEFYQKHASVKSQFRNISSQVYCKICPWRTWFPLATSYQHNL
jgi:hypothetical protein